MPMDVQKTKGILKKENSSALQWEKRNQINYGSCINNEENWHCFWINDIKLELMVPEF